MITDFVQTFNCTATTKKIQFLLRLVIEKLAFVFFSSSVPCSSFCTISLQSFWQKFCFLRYSFSLNPAKKTPVAPTSRQTNTGVAHHTLGRHKDGSGVIVNKMLL